MKEKAAFCVKNTLVKIKLLVVLFIKFPNKITINTYIVGFPNEYHMEFQNTFQTKLQTRS